MRPVPVDVDVGANGVDPFFSEVPAKGYGGPPLLPGEHQVGRPRRRDDQLLHLRAAVDAVLEEVLGKRVGKVEAAGEGRGELEAPHLAAVGVGEAGEGGLSLEVVVADVYEELRREAPQFIVVRPARSVGRAADHAPVLVRAEVGEPRMELPSRELTSSSQKAAALAPSCTMNLDFCRGSFGFQNGRGPSGSIMRHLASDQYVQGRQPCRRPACLSAAGTCGPRPRRETRRRRPST